MKSKKHKNAKSQVTMPVRPKVMAPIECFLFDNSNTIPEFCINEACQMLSPVPRLHGHICPKCKIHYITMQQKGRSNHYKVKKAFRGEHPILPSAVNLVGTNRENVIAEDKTEERYIEMRDFVIRGNLFRCIDNKHKMKNITAIAKVLTFSGKIIEKKCSACYCETCNQYSISKGSVENLKRNGIILCRMRDMDVELAPTKSTAHLWDRPYEMNEKSILYEFGYNVSKQDDLPYFIRQAILAAIVDSRIITKNGVSGYLNSFISLRQNRPNFEEAIAKWEEDREFIEQYQINSFKKYGIASIKKRT